tara:strand:- start:5 stop:724 length:720 start_codon:yes stop_codon:yes gene_type:complete
MRNSSVIIQARMGSQRLPGKILKKIANNSLLDWVIKRVKKSKKIKKIILATTKNKKDDILQEIANRNKIFFFRGQNQDVLGRFYKAAKTHGSEVIVRVCADNPFIDCKLIDLLIEKFKSKKYDYICNHQNRLNSRYADGFGAEIFSLELLQKLFNDAKKKTHREHVTQYVWENKKKFRILALQAPKSLAYPSLKFDINTFKDLNYIKKFVSANKINLLSTAGDIIKYKLKENKLKEVKP